MDYCHQEKILQFDYEFTVLKSLQTGHTKKWLDQTGFRTCLYVHPGPDIGPSKLCSCPEASTTKGPPHVSYHLLFFGILGWGSTTEGCPGASTCLNTGLRSPLSVRSPQATSLSRGTSFNKHIMWPCSSVTYQALWAVNSFFVLIYTHVYTYIHTYIHTYIRWPNG